MSIRVRFAPSPTGALHIGGIRTALYNYLLARKHGGTFVLRIEDTDQLRFVPGAEAYIINALTWCGLIPDEGVGFGGEYGPYRQSERKDIYGPFIQQLLDNGMAYHAFDTAEELEALREQLRAEGHSSFQYDASTRMRMRNSLSLDATEVADLLEAGVPYTVRLRINSGEKVMVNDLIRGEVTFNTDELDDKVLVKSDGMPTYHLANVVDDHLMRITHVIRGEEWLPSAGHHVLIYRAFGWSDTAPSFSHLPLILKPDGGGKLSKRDGLRLGIPVFPLGWVGNTPEDSFTGFREEGFDPKALLNFLALLGWSSGTDQEIFSIAELTELFSLDRINKSGARFDYEKAKWFNQQYLMHTPNEVLADLVRPIAAEHGHTPDAAWLARFCGLMKERVTVLPDFWTKGSFLFQSPDTYDAATIAKKWKPEMSTLFGALPAVFRSATEAADIETAVKAAITEHQFKLGDVMPLLRIALAGSMQGPGVFDMAALLGSEVAAERIEKFLTKM